MSKTARLPAYTDLAKEIGKRIRWARELVEPNRAAFARGLEVDRSTIRDAESGRRPPSIFLVLEISHQLRVTPNYILQGDMRGVDGELAAKLAVRHPELAGIGPFADTHGRDLAGSIGRRPKTRGRP